MKRRFKLGFLVLALVTAAALGASALAHGGPGHWQGKITQHIDEALDAAKASPQQKAAIFAARDHVFAAFEANRDAHKGELAEALSLFSAAELDQKAVADHRGRREAEMRQIGDAVVQAIYDAHDALTAPQRRAVADFVKAEHDQMQSHVGGFREKFVRHMVEERTESALDAINATAAQRAAVRTQRDGVLTVLQSTHADHDGDFEKMLALFTADKIDATQIDALRAEHQAKMHKVADTVVQAISDLHAQLSAGQRKALVEWVRSHAQHHHG